MNRLAKAGAYILHTGLKVRTIMLAFYAGIALGCFLMVAWVYTLKFATPHAVALLRWAI